MNIPFREEELNVVGRSRFKDSFVPSFDTPCSKKEGGRALLAKKPIWQLTFADTRCFTPRVIPDSVARAFVHDAGAPLPPIGGKDMFGVEWKDIEVAEGSMVIPGTPLLENANDWPERIPFPDLDSWDWEQDLEANRAYIAGGFTNLVLMNGWFERLISFMDFGGAAIALIDEEQKEAVKALLDRITDVYIEIYDRLIALYPEIDWVIVHDDWGSQRAPLFSPATAMEMFVPPMKKFTDHVHACGRVCEIHSCGRNEKLIEAYVAAGWDLWNPQLMNDTEALYEAWGDKITLAVAAPEMPEDATEEELREAARRYAEKFCDPDKPSTLNHYSVLPEPFYEELYRQSRLRYGK